MTANLQAPLPAVIRSEQDLLEQGFEFLPADALAPVALPISSEGVTFDMAQSAAWVDAEHFAVGRWDGSLTLFKFSESKSAGPLIAVAASSPSSEGVQMIVWVAPGLIATSNDDKSIAVWSPNAAWDRLELVTQLHYEPAFGPANSGEAFELNGGICLVVGHASGFITIWCSEGRGRRFDLVTTVDVRNEKPKNPWGIHNVRGIAPLQLKGQVPCIISGSENGDLCVISVPDGRIISRTVYNPLAQRGINAVVCDGLDVLVANCSVGAEDKNLWLYTIDPSSWELTVCDAVNLKVQPDALQVFNFAVVWGSYEKGRCFFSSTQEGTLWMGITEASKLSILGYQKVTAPIGAALAYASNGNLAFIAYDLYEFKTLPDGVGTVAENPQRLQAGGS